MNDIKKRLIDIYGAERGRMAFERLLFKIERFPTRSQRNGDFFSQADVILITYGDTLYQRGEAPLKTFSRFAHRYFKGAFSTIHFLPFFPFSSDDGFSVKDYFSVNPALGSWEDIKTINQEFKLMFDFVLNHISAESQWFERYLKGEDGFKDLAIEIDPSTDLSTVARPRSLPLLSRFKKKSREVVHLWTTFSSDQIDLNYKSIDVLEKMIDVLLFYIDQGAAIVRMDAIAYLWKEIGTTCIHLPQTHNLVKLFRRILNVVAPDVLIITETNVPHDENISYFGNGEDEAQMVYNFTLPPLLLHAFVTQDSTLLSQWAKSLKLPSVKNTFFNFTASHDGIGVRPLEGILPAWEIDRLLGRVKKNGGFVSYKKNSDGSESPYEMNIAYVDALLEKSGQRDRFLTHRFLASQAIQLALPGVPGIYIHSLLGSRNWEAGVRQTKRARSINREKLPVEDIFFQLKDPETFRSRIFFRYMNMIKVRSKLEAFHPNAGHEVLTLDPRVFAIARHVEKQTIYALTNVSSARVPVSLPEHTSFRLRDILGGREINARSFRLEAYQTLWLTSRGCQGKGLAQL